MEEKSKQKKHENIAMYFVYATAAYFGLQFLLKGNKAAAATINPNKVADPPFVYTEAASTAYEPLPPMTATSTAKKASQGNVPKKITVWIAEAFPLRKGMIGDSIKELQRKLGVNPDRKFGEGTEEALRKQYGISTVTKDKYQSIIAKSTFSKIVDAITPKAATQDLSPVLKMGSRGEDVYRLQKWLGFKDMKVAKKGEPLADKVFGNQTLTALQKKAGKSTISTSQLNALLLGGFGFGYTGMDYAGEVIITRRTTIILNGNLLPHRTVPKNTILGTRLLELKDPEQKKAYTQFQTIDGFHRWVEQDAVYR